MNTTKRAEKVPGTGSTFYGPFHRAVTRQCPELWYLTRHLYYNYRQKINVIIKMDKTTDPKVNSGRLMMRKKGVR